MFYNVVDHHIHRHDLIASKCVVNRIPVTIVVSLFLWHLNFVNDRKLFIKVFRILIAQKIS